MDSLEAAVEFSVLGPMEVRSGGQPLSVGAPRVRALLAVLLIRRGRQLGIDRLIEELWPADRPRHARTVVHGSVSRLRRALRAGGPDAAARLVTNGRGYLLRAADDEVDLLRFEDAAGDREPAGRHRSAAEVIYRGIGVPDPAGLVTRLPG